MEWIKRNCSQEFLLGAQLTLTQRGLLISLRDYAGAMNGIPADALQIVAKACGVSRYLFSKNWPVLVKFFTLRGDVWVHRDDQAQIDAYQDNHANAQKTGRIGAQRRWNAGHSSAAVQSEIPFSDNRVPIQTPSQKLEAKNLVEKYPAAATSAEVETPPEAAAAPPQKLQKTSKPLQMPPPDYQKQVMQRCVELGLSVPDQRFIDKLWQRFPNIPPSRFPRFPDQYSPGLWLQKTEPELGIQADTEGMRKPTVSEKQRLQDESDERAFRAAGIL